MSDTTELLEKIQRTPLLVGKKSLSSLASFLTGYCYCKAKCNAETGGMIPGFQEFVAARYNDVKHSYYTIIENQCTDDAAAFDKFYELLYEFYNLSNEKNKDIPYKAPDIEVLFHFKDNSYVSQYMAEPLSYQMNESHIVSGSHHFFPVCGGKGWAPRDGIIRASVALATPDSCPNSLWIGKTIPVLCSAMHIGDATVIDVFNPVLLEGNGNNTRDNTLP